MDEITKVLDMKAGTEYYYSLPPKKAVIAANEQKHNNYNTWDYNFENHPELRETDKFYFCGDFGASKKS